MESFVQSVWHLVGSNKLPAIADDSVRLPALFLLISERFCKLVSQSLRFISESIRCGYYKSLFSSKETIHNLVQAVVVPNVTLREHDIEQFEDDPLDFIRVDLAVSATGTDLATRRQAAADILQSLVGSGYEADTTAIVGILINTGLSEYTQNKVKNWKSKDSAIYLLTALATKGSTLQVRSTLCSVGCFLT